MGKLTHLDDEGNAVMVDVTDKDVTKRVARAAGKITMNREAFSAIEEGRVKKGDVLATARIAGIMAAKNTSSLIPLCHPLMLTKVEVDIKSVPDECAYICECTAALSGKTGVEMEALTGTSVALLTIYDMCKALDREMVISDICLMEKDGGRSGHFVRDEDSRIITE
ncbi:MAG: cyclic pyranopterin monophosphate synthase MoaC [Lachnospiraceae bacterium]|nr:cyclic pyranopterin monophosphate synthase MoaC [Lachnospiraceae bacterium]